MLIVVLARTGTCCSFLTLGFDSGLTSFFLCDVLLFQIGEISVSKTGKHGHAKCKFVGTHVFTKAKVEDSQSSSHGMLKFDLIKKTYTLQNLEEDGGVSMMEDNADAPKDDLNLPERDDAELCAKIRDMWTIYEGGLMGKAAEELTAKHDGIGEFDSECDIYLEVNRGPWGDGAPSGSPIKEQIMAVNFKKVA
jgi:translation elongation factor P/translation initiation factor 5A